MPSRITIAFYAPTAGQSWTNRYFTTDLWTAGGTTMDALVAAHKPVLTNNMYITNIRIDDNVEDTDNYDTVSVNQLGTQNPAGAELMPLWVTARVDFDVAGGGSPSRKYLRGFLREDLSNFTLLHTGAVTVLETFGNAIVAIGTICDPQGNLFVDAVPYLSPQMRQLKRASKKPVTP